VNTFILGHNVVNVPVATAAAIQFYRNTRPFWERAITEEQITANPRFTIDDNTDILASIILKLLQDACRTFFLIRIKSRVLLRRSRQSSDTLSALETSSMDGSQRLVEAPSN
jgi:hypothetical protein